MKNYVEYALNKDADITASQIPVMWHYISITIPLAKMYACFLLLSSYWGCKSVHTNVREWCQHPCSMHIIHIFFHIIITPTLDHYKLCELFLSLCNLCNIRISKTKTMAWSCPLMLERNNWFIICVQTSSIKLVSFHYIMYLFNTWGSRTDFRTFSA